LFLGDIAPPSFLPTFLFFSAFYLVLKSERKGKNKEKKTEKKGPSEPKNCGKRLYFWCNFI